MIPKKAKMMRIYVGEDDDWNGTPLYHAIVEKLHDLGIEGCTVSRGVEGYGRGGAIHRAKRLAVAQFPLWIRILIPAVGSLPAGLVLMLGARWSGPAKGWDILVVVRVCTTTMLTTARS